MSDLMPRSVAVSLIHEQLSDPHSNRKQKEPGEDASQTGVWFYGRVELRRLMDAIYGGPPTCEEEKVR